MENSLHGAERQGQSFATLRRHGTAMAISHSTDRATMRTKGPITVAALLALTAQAHAHGIAGNRFFPGTRAFDDPAVVWQMSFEVIVPLNSQGGHDLGTRARLLLFLDDLAPSLFGKPLLSH